MLEFMSAELQVQSSWCCDRKTTKQLKSARRELHDSKKVVISAEWDNGLQRKFAPSFTNPCLSGNLISDVLFLRICSICSGGTPNSYGPSRHN
jgi:hypothetical protein